MTERPDSLPLMLAVPSSTRGQVRILARFVPVTILLLTCYCRFCGRQSSTRDGPRPIRTVFALERVFCAGLETLRSGRNGDVKRPLQLKAQSQRLTRENITCATSIFHFHSSLKPTVEEVEKVNRKCVTLWSDQTRSIRMDIFNSSVGYPSLCFYECHEGYLEVCLAAQ